MPTHLISIRRGLPILLILLTFGLHGQKKEDGAIRVMITNFKEDVRGPYKDIRWFCKDGSTVAPKERCAEPGGVQRARYKDEVAQLAKTNHLFLGQILSTTDHQQFWDEDNAHSRLKQFQIELFLRANDNGWINRKARYYRGAFQAEDEEAWGIEFYLWLLNRKHRLESQYFLIRQSAKDIPHAGDSDLAQRIRAVSREISDQYPAFMNLRVKVHGQPEIGDINDLKAFKTQHATRLGSELTQKMDVLIKDMESLFEPVKPDAFKNLAARLPKTSPAFETIQKFTTEYAATSSFEERCRMISNTAVAIRSHSLENYNARVRLALLDISNKLETILLTESSNWKCKTLQQQMQKIHCLSEAAAGFGYMELWEWQELSSKLTPPNSTDIGLVDLMTYSEDARRAVEWGTSMVRSVYEKDVKKYAGFEPLANGFVDDKVRASILLPLGSNVSQIGDFFSSQAGFANNVMGISDQSSLRGLNPGYALGELVVTEQTPEEVQIFSDKIYVFDRPPADLKPVAGIATVTEGNLVSHVQLLARNLGIPNAVLSKKNLQDLKAFNGERVFFAVSNKGTVILKPASKLTKEEASLFEKKTRSDDRVRVPIEQIELDDFSVLNLRDVNASNSGKTCGPKAANLGQLKQMYPENVVEGLVIPFSVFKRHFDQKMPNSTLTYWEYLNDIFASAQIQTKAGQSESLVERSILDRLQVLRAAIKEMPLLKDFQTDLQQKFVKVLGAEMGKIPVFLRSDTNMEDLKDFTGAGLNLTLFNVLSVQKIWDGIRDVWASPYTERSYQWRQSYLLNPENVFPSILIIPSVNADYSGVMITKGVSTGGDQDITVAFNRGVGGAVEGQASESWLLIRDNTNRLLSPGREMDYTSLPSTGGTEKRHTSFESRMLTHENLIALRGMAESMKSKLGQIDVTGPYDIELGLKDENLWLFQVRPFVENKRATASDYLRSISPKVDDTRRLLLTTEL